MRFTDAHATSSICTPSRYSLLTGRYAWRSKLKSGIVWNFDGSLIESDRVTVSKLLKSSGDETACIGKWHLGLDWPTSDGSHPNDTLEFGNVSTKKRREFEAHIDYSGRIGGGPTDRGYDSYFGVDVPNFPPYGWIENDRLQSLPTEHKPTDLYGLDGMATPQWRHEDMLPALTRRALDFIEQRAVDMGSACPYFFYLALTSPHSPVVPNEEFLGKSGIGGYGDFVVETDWVVGQVIDAVKRCGQLDNTLIIFTSDNGPEDLARDDEGVFERVRRTAHYSMGPLRGMKYDAWEGGHRVPFIASWPGMIPAETVCNNLVSLMDLYETCAAITDTKVPVGEGEDSISMWSLLRGSTGSECDRKELVCHSASGKFALRQGDWLMIDAPSGGEAAEPHWFCTKRGYGLHDHPSELFNLKIDLC